ncbi:MAG: hypothetical protein ACHREM_14575 [Polyangiales bacterium]
MSAAKNQVSQQIAIRLPHDAVTWLAAEAQRRNDADPGLGVTMSDVVRVLIIRAMRESGATSAAPATESAPAPAPNASKASKAPAKRRRAR